MGDATLESVLPAIEQRVAQQVTDAHLPGAAVGIVRGQKLVWSQGFGCAISPPGGGQTRTRSTGSARSRRRSRPRLWCSFGTKEAVARRAPHVEMPEMLLKAKAAAPKAVAEVSLAPCPAAWRPYLGRYARAGLMGRQVQVECRNGTLLITVLPASGRAAQPLTRLEPGEQPHHFLVKDQRFAGEFATFSPAADGTVAGIDLGGFPFRKWAEARG